MDLKGWESFYVIVGSSGGALTGLQFVVVALTVDVNRRASLREIDTFATPTVVHFSTALLVSALLSAPWPTTTGPAIGLGALGVAGVMYTLAITRRASRVRYSPVFEDWIFHSILPLCAYLIIGIAGILLPRSAEPGLYGTAAATLLLLVIGIHNSWDSVTFIAFGEQEEGAPTPKRNRQKGHRG